MNIKKTTKKIFAALLAGTIAAGTLASLTASAETAIPGDVDLDGYVTGHDAAMVSRYLDGYTDLLTADQLAIADMDGNGTVDQADADLIFDSAAYHLCDINPNNNYWHITDIDSAYLALLYVADTNAGIPIEVVTSGTPLESLSNPVNTYEKQHQIDLLVYHLLDANGDGTLSMHDVELNLISYAVECVKPEPFIYLKESCYYISFDYLYSGENGIFASPVTYT